MICLKMTDRLTRFPKESEKKREIIRLKGEQVLIVYKLFYNA